MASRSRSVRAWNRLADLFRLGEYRQEKLRSRSKVGQLAVEALEPRDMPANPGLVISEFLANPSGTDSPFEYVELRATRTIDFTTTPFSVVFAETTGSFGSSGWASGGIYTYGFSITTGSVSVGDVVYVGGSSMTPTGPKLRTINTATTPGDGFGVPRSAGVLGNGGDHADGIAVFDTAIGSVTSSTVPVDAILFGLTIGNAASVGYVLPTNDMYSGGTAGVGTSLAPDPSGGDLIYATGVFDLGSDTWAFRVTVPPHA